METRLAWLARDERPQLRAERVGGNGDCFYLAAARVFNSDHFVGADAWQPLRPFYTVQRLRAIVAASVTPAVAATLAERARVLRAAGEEDDFGYALREGGVAALRAHILQHAGPGGRAVTGSWGDEYAQRTLSNVFNLTLVNLRPVCPREDAPRCAPWGAGPDTCVFAVGEVRPDAAGEGGGDGTPPSTALADGNAELAALLHPHYARRRGHPHAYGLLWRPSGGHWDAVYAAAAAEEGGAPPRRRYLFPGLRTLPPSLAAALLRRASDRGPY